LLALARGRQRARRELKRDGTKSPRMGGGTIDVSGQPFRPGRDFRRGSHSVRCRSKNRSATIPQPRKRKKKQAERETYARVKNDSGPHSSIATSNRLFGTIGKLDHAVSESWPRSGTGLMRERGRAANRIETDWTQIAAPTRDQIAGEVLEASPRNHSKTEPEGHQSERAMILTKRRPAIGLFGTLCLLVWNPVRRTAVCSYPWPKDVGPRAGESSRGSKISSDGREASLIAPRKFLGLVQAIARFRTQSQRPKISSPVFIQRRILMRALAANRTCGFRK